MNPLIRGKLYLDAVVIELLIREVPIFEYLSNFTRQKCFFLYLLHTKYVHY